MSPIGFKRHRFTVNPSIKPKRDSPENKRAKTTTGPCPK